MPSKKKYLVTGGTGFIGSALVRKLLSQGHEVRVLDNDSRGSAQRLADVAADFEMIDGDVRDLETVVRAAKGVDSVCHLAFINGTEFFYSKPELVLEVGVKGMTNVLDASIRQGVPELVLASSSEVYQTPPIIPTPESVPMLIPDPLNPRYSYAAGKIISEIMAINYGRTRFERTLIFRPHNVYGPEMGWEHVIPQFVLRMNSAIREGGSDVVKFPLQGDGSETRSFVYIDDFADGLALILEHGENLGIYNIGTDDEIAIAGLARLVGEFFKKTIEVVPGAPAIGGTPRRCPDVAKLAKLGYRPRVPLREGLAKAATWYVENEHRAPSATQSA